MRTALNLALMVPRNSTTFRDRVKRVLSEEH